MVEQRLTLQQLAAYNGSDVAKPIMLAIQGTVFDVTKGAAQLLQGFEVFRVWSVLSGRLADQPTSGGAQ